MNRLPLQSPFDIRELGRFWPVTGNGTALETRTPSTGACPPGSRQLFRNGRRTDTAPSQVGTSAACAFDKVDLQIERRKSIRSCSVPAGICRWKSTAQRNRNDSKEKKLVAAKAQTDDQIVY